METTLFYVIGGLVFGLRPDLDRLRRTKAGQEGRVSFVDRHDARLRPGRFIRW